MIRRYPFTAFIALGILVLSVIHLDRAPKLNIEHGDKLGHFIAYSVFCCTWLIEQARVRQWSNTANHWSIHIVVTCIFYGILLEYMQSSAVVQRNFDYYDMLANAFGALIGFAIFKWNRHLFAKLLK